MNKSVGFAERLSEMMTEHGINAPALADVLKTDRSNITRYLRAEQSPYFELFVKMIDFFVISADYMLGISDYSPSEGFKKAKPFAEQLRLVMQGAKVTQYRMEKDLHISGSVMYRWLNGQSLPTVESLAKLAEYMDCSVDFLLGRSD